MISRSAQANYGFRDSGRDCTYGHCFAIDMAWIHNRVQTVLESPCPDPRSKTRSVDWVVRVLLQLCPTGQICVQDQRIA